MTVSISHDHKCYLSFRYSWVLYLVNECFHPESEPMMIQKEKWLLYSVILYRCSWKEGNELSLSGSTESQPQQSQELFLSDSPKEAGQKKRRGRVSSLRKQLAALQKALQKSSQQQWNSTLTSTEVKKRFNPYQSTSGFSIKNTSKQLWVMPNKFNNRWNHSKWQLQNTKQTQKKWWHKNEKE